MDNKAALQQAPSKTETDSDVGNVLLAIDEDAERSYVRKHCSSHGHLLCSQHPSLSLHYRYLQAHGV